MLSLYEIKKILSKSVDSTPSDDFRIIQSWTEYDEKSSKSPESRNLEYLCYELEVMNPDTGKRTRFYKAIRFARVIRLPANAKQSTAFMDMQEQVLAAAYEQGYNLITIIANVIKPVSLGLLYLYGVQGVSENLAEAKRQAKLDFNGFIGSMQATFRVLEMKVAEAQETEWLREKMFGMEYMTVVRGIPKANKAGEDMGNKGMGGSNLNPDSQGTLEEIIAGLVDYEYVIEVLSTPVYMDTLMGWQRQSQKEMTMWYSQLQGQKSLSFNLSIPMMYMANASQSQGWSKAYTDANTVSYAEGESYSQSQGQSIGQSMTQTFGQSVGRSVTNSVSQGITQSRGVTFGETVGQNHSISQSFGESLGSNVSNGHSFGASVGQNNSVSQNFGSSYNESLSNGQSVNQSSSLTEGMNASQSSSHSEGSNVSMSQSQNTGVSQNVGYSHNTGMGQSSTISNTQTSGVSESASQSHSTGSSTGVSMNESYGSGTSDNWSVSSNQGYSNSESYGHSTNESSGSSWNAGLNGSLSAGIPLVANGSVGASAGIGGSTSSGESTSNNYSSSESASWGTGWSGGVSSNHSLSSGVSNSVTENTGVTQGYSVSNSQSTGLSQGVSTNESWGESGSYGTSFSEGLSRSLGSSISDSNSVSIGNSVSQGQSMGYGLNSSVSQGQGISNSIGSSSGSNTGLNMSDSISEGTSFSQNASMSESTGTSYSQSVSQNYGVSESQTLGQSLGQTASESVSAGYGQNIGQTESVSSGQSYTKSNGSSQGTSTGTSGTATLGTSSSMGLGPSIGYSKSYQWLDQGVKDLLELMEFQNERIKKALRGQGAFYTYVYIACPSLDALATAQAVAKTTWQNEFAMVQPLQVLDLTETEQKHLLYHFSAFSADVSREDVFGVSEYKYCTVLLSEEYVAYTHLPRVSEGGVFSTIQDIPKFSVPSMLKGEVYMGTILNSERFSFKNGYRTPYDYRISESMLMHAYVTGASRSGKTVTAMRFVAELAHIRRSKTGKRLRIVAMDPKKDWRTLARFVEPERFNFYSMGDVNFNPLKLNVWKVPKGVWPQIWIDGLIDIYCRAYGLLERGKQMIAKVVYDLYNEAGVMAACDQPNWREEVPRLSSKVNFRKIYNRFVEEQEALSKPGKSGNDTKDAYARLQERLSCFGRDFSIECRLFGTSEGVGIDELIGGDDVTVLESKGLENTFKNFIFGAVTSGFFKYALSREDGYLAEDQYETVLVIEEANEVLTGNDAAGSGGGNQLGMSGQSEFEQILDQAAGLGLFIVAITQKIADMPSSIIANSGIVFAGRLSRVDDINVVVRSIGREERIDDRDVVKWFPRSPTGWFVCKTSRASDFKDAEPILVQISPLNISPPNNHELNEILTLKAASRYLKKGVA